jgi:ankyrin repeat protein
LRLDKTRSEAFLRAATALLDAGADPNSGFWSKDEYHEWETALYGAAGVAHHADLTRLLLERGADPNDNETFYHAPETYDNDALKVLVESGKMRPDLLAGMLLRKADWHDYDGMKYLLEHGADPNRITIWGYTALHQTLRRDNALRNIELLLEHGADPAIKTVTKIAARFPPVNGQRTAWDIAAHRGRGDVLEAMERRGITMEFSGVDRLIAACARGNAQAVRAIAAGKPQLVEELLVHGGTLLAEFSGNDNADGVQQLLDLGGPVDALYDGDPYFDIAKNSTALHVAAWKAWPETGKLLIERGANVNAQDAKSRTPLMLAVKACVDSYWTSRRSPESVEALLKAGASISGVEYPCGYDEVDVLLKSYRER